MRGLVAIGLCLAACAPLDDEPPLTAEQPAAATACSPAGNYRQSLLLVEGDCDEHMDATLAILGAGGVLADNCAVQDAVYRDSGCTLQITARGCLSVAPGVVVSSEATLHARDDGTWSGPAEITVRVDSFSAYECEGTYIVTLSP